MKVTIRRTLWKLVVLMLLWGQVARAQEEPTPPPAPGIEIQSVAFDELRNSFRVEFLLANQGLIFDLDVKVESVRAGVLAYRQTHAVQPTIELTADTFTRGEEYQLTVTALNSQGQPIVGIVPGSFSSSQPQTIQDERRFLYPALASPEIEIVSVDLAEDADPPAYRITLRQANTGEVDAYSVWLENEVTGLRAIPELVFSAPLSNPLTVPLDGLSAGRYRLIVNALDGSSNIVASHNRQGMAFEPDAPGLFQRMGGSPLLVGFIVIVILVLMGVVLMMTVFRPRVSEYEFGRSSFKGHTRQFSGEDKHRTAMRFEKKRREELRRMARLRQGYAVLEVVRGGDLTGQQIEIISYPFVMGREAADLSIPDKRISGRHGSIIQENGTYYLEDHQSTNGTFVNNARVERVRQPLNDGDMINLGSGVLLRFKVVRPS